MTIALWFSFELERLNQANSINYIIKSFGKAKIIVILNCSRQWQIFNDMVTIILPNTGLIVIVPARMRG